MLIWSCLYLGVMSNIIKIMLYGVCRLNTPKSYSGDNWVVFQSWERENKKEKWNFYDLNAWDRSNNFSE